MGFSALIRYATCGLITFLYWPHLAFAEQAARPAYTPPPPAISYGSMAQIIFSLLLVLDAFVLVAWVLKRINVPQKGAGNILKVLSGVPVGQRERIVLVEVKDTWLVPPIWANAIFVGTLLAGLLAILWLQRGEGRERGHRSD